MVSTEAARINSVIESVNFNSSGVLLIDTSSKHNIMIKESILITIAGGIIGIIFGILVSLLIAWGANSYGLDWKFSLPIRAFVVSLPIPEFAPVTIHIFPSILMIYNSFQLLL